MNPADDLARLTTEAANPASEHLDRLSAREIVELMNREDARVHQAVREVLPQVAQAVELVAQRLRNSGRLIYIGAGTSGRLGVLDAAECPPTFRTPPEMVLGIIAGGPPALVRAVEGLEDHPELGRQDLQKVNLWAADVVVGIATSGRTPYVLGALAYAQQIGAATVGISCNADPELARVCQVLITPIVGPEVVSGSTRLKAGTATKMALNMISTGATVIQAVKALRRAGCGKVYVACTHAVISEETLQQILERGVEDVIATDTVLTSLSRVSVAHLISEAIGELA